MQSAPPLALAAAEPVRAALETALFVTRADASGIDGTGTPVIVYPGLGTNALATAALRSYLRRCGYAVYDWGMGVNTGPSEDFDVWLHKLANRLDEVHAAHRRRVSLVGWSLGGIYARELAKLRPDRVARVVTLGTPFAGHPEATNARLLYTLLNGRAPDASPELLARLRQDPPAPTYSVFSRSDGIVHWRCAEAPPQSRTRNVTLSNVSHLGLVVHPDVLHIVARLLEPNRPV